MTILWSAGRIIFPDYWRWQNIVAAGQMCERISVDPQIRQCHTAGPLVQSPLLSPKLPPYHVIIVGYTKELTFAAGYNPGEWPSRRILDRVR